jgi:hypothetical protein
MIWLVVSVLTWVIMGTLAAKAERRYQLLSQNNKDLKFVRIAFLGGPFGYLFQFIDGDTRRYMREVHGLKPKSPDKPSMLLKFIGEK